MSVTLVAGIYGMNFDNMPELHWRYGYFWALGLMAAISVGLVVLFRRIKWL
jgi:magnesium transporter